MRKGWELTRIGDLLTIQNGFAFDSKSFSQSKGEPLIRIRDLKDGQNTETRYDGPFEKRYEVKYGDLLIGMDGEFGCYEWRGGKALLNQRVCRLEGFSGKLEPKFLFYGINKYLKEIEDATTYTTVKHLSSKQILDVEIPLPPFAEQQRIVAILDEAFAGLATATANAGRNLGNARALFESHLNSIFTQKNAGWTGKSLSDLIDVTHGFAFDGKYFVEGYGDHPILLTPGNFTEVGSLDFNARNTKRFTGAVSPNFVLRKDDLVVVMTDLSSKMKVLGKPAFVDRDGILHNQRIGRVIFRDSSLWSEYLYYFFRTAQFTAGIKDTATGTMVKHTAPKRILAAVVPIPPTLDEQKSIAAKLNDLSSQVEKLEAQYQEKLRDLTTLKQAILQKAFSGELNSPPSQAIKEAAE